MKVGEGKDTCWRWLIVVVVVVVVCGNRGLVAMLDGKLFATNKYFFVSHIYSWWLWLVERVARVVVKRRTQNTYKNNDEGL